jgi:hypothetical protein
MKLVLVSVLVLVVLFISLSCNEGYDYSQAALGLGLRDYSCTEAWIEVQIGSNDKTANIYIKKNGEIIQTVNVGQSSTLYYFDFLLPNTNYTFDAVTYEDGKEVKSNPVTFTTLDTTSHNFSWQTFTFGEHQHSVLYDVAIVNENDIWAVGAIYMNDSLGQPDTQPYAIAHWDGTTWTLMKVPYHDFNQTIKYPGPLFAISIIDSEIFVASYANFLKWVNGNWEEKAFFMKQIPFDGQVLKIFGNDENNIYCVGRNGAIYYYFNSGWNTIGSGTTVNLNDISGMTVNNTIWACGYTNDYGTSALIKIKDGVVEKVFEGLSNSQSNGFYAGPISGVWSDNEYRVFMMNWGGIYLQRNNNQFFLEKEIARFSDAGLGIDGTAYNNVFACGEGFVGHWNGYSYKEYPELLHQQRTFKSVKANTNTVCVVGLDYNSPIFSQAVIVLGEK